MRRTSDDQANHIMTMARTKGWEIFESFLRDDIESLKKSLVNKDATDLAEIALLQGEIRGLESILSWIKERHNQVLKQL